MKKLTKFLPLFVLLLFSSEAFAQGDTWATKTPMPSPGSELMGDVIQGRLYVVNRQESLTPELRVYDAASNMWSSATPPPTHRTTGAAVAIDGKLYVVGGCLGADCNANRVTNLLEVYDPASDTWETKAPMPTPRCCFATAAIDGKLYVAGGTVACDPCLPLSTLEMYDPLTNTWTDLTTTAPMPHPRTHMGGAAIDGKLYVPSGVLFTANNVFTIEGTLDVYDPATNSWTTKAPMPTPRGGFVLGAIGGQLFVVGGNNFQRVGSGATFFSTNEVYDPLTNTWAAGAPMPTARAGMVAGVIHSQLHVAGGKNPFLGVPPFGSLDVLEVYMPPEPVLLAFFLHGSGGTANPPTLFLDSAAPTATTAKYKDSASLNFSGGNSWKEIGTWSGGPELFDGMLINLGSAGVWIGLKNSDDQGTQFDLRAEAYKNAALVASGETRCITGVTRNPALAKEVAIPFDPFSPVGFDGTTDILRLRILTRIGTNPDGTKCSGPGGSHGSAVGLRLYFDAVSRDSNFEGTLSP